MSFVLDSRFDHYFIWRHTIGIDNFSNISLWQYIWYNHLITLSVIWIWRAKISYETFFIQPCLNILSQVNNYLKFNPCRDDQLQRLTIQITIQLKCYIWLNWLKRDFQKIFRQFMKSKKLHSVYSINLAKLIHKTQIYQTILS